MVRHWDKGFRKNKDPTGIVHSLNARGIKTGRSQVPSAKFTSQQALEFAKLKSTISQAERPTPQEFIEEIPEIPSSEIPELTSPSVQEESVSFAQPKESEGEIPSASSLEEPSAPHPPPPEPPHLGEF